MRKKCEKFFAVILSLIMILSSVATAYAATGTVVDRRQFSVKEGSTTWSFVVNDGKVDMNGTCMEPQNGLIPEKKQTADFVKLSSSSSLCKLAYLALNEFSTDVQQYAVGRAAAYLAGNIPYNNYEYYQTVNSLIERSQNVTVPSNFEAYRVKPTNGAQEILAWRLIPNGKLTLTKSVSSSNGYSISGAEYSVYSDSARNNKVGTLTTKSDGSTNTLSLKPGTYYVKETKAPKGWKLDDKTYAVTIKESATSTVKSTEKPSDGYLKLQKKVTQETGYSISGAEYSVYSDSARKNKVGTLTTKSDGSTNTLTLAPGTYYVKETKAPTGWKLDETTHSIKVSSLATSTVTSTEKPDEGYLTLTKEVANNSKLVAECPENYTLAGAKYGVYTTKAGANENAASKRVGYLTTKEDGSTNKLTLVTGTYYVKEVEAPKGYALNKTVYTVTVKSGETATVKSSEAPRFDPLNIKVTKKAAEGSDKNLSVEGAEYTIKYYKEFKNTRAELDKLKPYRTWVIKTDKNGFTRLKDDYLVKEKSDPLFKTEQGIPVGLHGTYVIEETLAPTGFAKTEKVWIQQASFDSYLQEITSQLEDITDNEKPQTVSITLNKVDADTGKNEAQGYGSLAGAKYDVYYFDSTKAEDIKVATLTTDERGYAKYENGKPGLYKVVETKASKGYVLDKETHEVKARIKEANTANFNYTVKSKETPITVEIDKTTIDENGNKIALAGAELKLLDKDKNVLETFKTKETSHVLKGLSPGTYYIRETKTPDGYLKLEKDLKFTVKETGEVQKVEVFNEPVPEIQTSASFYGNKNAAPSEKMKVTDIFSYIKVVPTQEYVVKGQLVEKATGEVIANAEKRFTAETTNGNIEVEFEFDGTKYNAGTELVAVEKLYRIGVAQDERLVAIHEDLNDLNQTVNIPTIKTTATDKSDNGKDLNASENQTIIDKVEYTNLYVGREYTVKGVLMSKATGEPILDDGKEVTAEKTFVAETSNGVVGLEFLFNASALKGETIVVFESLYENDIEVGFHKDIEDTEQSVYVPEIHTTATSQEDGTKSVLPVKDITICDKIEYKNLIIGQMYQVEGTLVNTITKEIVAKSTGCFIAEETDGFVTLDFTFDATDLADKEVVVFEEIFKLDENGEKVKKVGEHADLTDKGQTVKIESPQIGTTANFKDGEKENTASKEMVIVDKVEYKNLVVGKEYTVKGVLMDKATGKPFVAADGKEVTAEKTFVAETSNGIVELEFRFNAENMDNAEVVVFEELFYGEEQLAAHADLDDEGQTVKIVKYVEPEKSEVVPTGDTTNVGLYVMFLISSILLLAVAVICKRHRI